MVRVDDAGRLTPVVPELFNPYPEEIVMLKKLLGAVALSALVSIAPANAQEMKELNFGIISTESSQNLKSDWQPILDDMAKKDGYENQRIFCFRLRRHH